MSETNLEVAKEQTRQMDAQGCVVRQADTMASLLVGTAAPAMGRMTPDRYVCAFRGRRDAYQVPLALAEAGLLEQFITDGYAQSWLRALARFAPSGLRAKVEFRFDPGLPLDRVRCLWGTTGLEHLRHGLGCPSMLTYNKLDRYFSLAAARRAAQTRSHLFLYSPYAWEAFTASYSHNPHKVLFQYHPHPALERRVLEEDTQRHPGVGQSFSGIPDGQVPEPLLQRERDVWKHADLIICASTFTKKSLLEAGADERICQLAPYGIEAPSVSQIKPPGDAFHAVFVGSGGRRKGLHHLLLAWQRASLPRESHLTLVCRVIDPDIERMAASMPRVTIARGVGAGRLNEIYAQSTLFVMPSLVEGFGQVYLEALAQGCPVLGTANTCLPDLGGEDDGVFLVDAGNVEELTSKLESLSRSLPGNHKCRMAARACAQRFTWPAFRDTIRKALQQPRAQTSTDGPV